MNEIIFRSMKRLKAPTVLARSAIRYSTLGELRAMVRDAVRCHFDEGQGPRVIRLHYVRDEVLAA